MSAAVKNSNATAAKTKKIVLCFWNPAPGYAAVPNNEPMHMQMNTPISRRAIASSFHGFSDSTGATY